MRPCGWLPGTTLWQPTLRYRRGVTLWQRAVGTDCAAALWWCTPPAGRPVWNQK